MLKTLQISASTFWPGPSLNTLSSTPSQAHPQLPHMCAASVDAEVVPVHSPVIYHQHMSLFSIHECAFWLNECKSCEYIRVCYKCISVHVYTQTHVCVYTYTHIHTAEVISVHAPILWVFSLVYVHIQACMHIYTYTNPSICTYYPYIYTYFAYILCEYIYIYTNNIYMCTYIYWSLKICKSKTFVCTRIE